MEYSQTLQMVTVFQQISLNPYSNGILTDMKAIGKFF